MAAISQFTNTQRAVSSTIIKKITLPFWPTDVPGTPSLPERRQVYTYYFQEIFYSDFMWIL